MKMPSILRVVLLVTAVLGLPVHVPAEEAPANEYQVKAAFLYNFARFVEWPPEAPGKTGAVMNLCILGEDPFGNFLNEIQGKQVRDRRLAVSRISSVQEAANCHILFISWSERGRLQRILRSVRDSSVLSVSEVSSFTENGGVIQFTSGENRVAFDINVEAAERAGLRVSSRLLSVARSVRGKSGKEHD